MKVMNLINQVNE